MAIEAETHHRRRTADLLRRRDELTRPQDDDRYRNPLWLVATATACLAVLKMLTVSG